MEAVIQQLTTQLTAFQNQLGAQTDLLQQLQQQIGTQQATIATQQQAIAATHAQAVPPPPPANRNHVGVDTKLLGRPDNFEKEEKWPECLSYY